MGSLRGDTLNIYDFGGVKVPGDRQNSGNRKQAPGGCLSEAGTGGVSHFSEAGTGGVPHLCEAGSRGDAPFVGSRRYTSRRQAPWVCRISRNLGFKHVPLSGSWILRFPSPPSAVRGAAKHWPPSGKRQVGSRYDTCIYVYMCVYVYIYIYIFARG